MRGREQLFQGSWFVFRHAGSDGLERSGIGFATIKRDRFVALEASFDGGELVTKPLQLQTAGLHLNATCDFGEIFVEVLDLDGNVLARSKGIQSDSLDIAVEWAQAFSRPDCPVKLRVQLSNARLFALWCQ